jgi:hypothetical protein
VPLENLVWGSIVLAALVVSGAMKYFSAENRLKRTLRAVRVWPIGELPEGTLGRVIGDAQPIDRVLQSPLTGRRCLYYVARVEGNRSGNWHTRFEEKDGVPFLLTDDSGRAIIDPSCADAALTFDHDSRSDTVGDPTPTEAAFLAKHGGKAKGWIFNEKLRYVEAVIEPGKRIAVLGSGVRDPDPQGTPAEGYRSAAPTLLRLTSSPRHPLMISNDPSTTDATAQARAGDDPSAGSER